MTLTEAEGAGTGLEVRGRYLLATTAGLWAKVWDLSKREPRLHIHPISLAEKIPGLPASVREIK